MSQYPCPVLVGTMLMIGKAGVTPLEGREPKLTALPNGNTAPLAVATQSPFPAGVATMAVALLTPEGPPKLAASPNP